MTFAEDAAAFPPDDEFLKLFDQYEESVKPKTTAKVKYNFDTLMRVLKEIDEIMGFVLFKNQRLTEETNSNFIGDYFNIRDHFRDFHGMVVNTEEDGERRRDTCYFEIDKLLDLKNENEEKLVELHKDVWSLIAAYGITEIIELA